MGGVYRKQKFGWEKKWRIVKLAKAGGDRVMADGMSEQFAALVVRLLNEDEDRQSNYVSPLERGLLGEGRD